ncbi:AAA family ATPase [Sulfurospirillum arcachonense]|uniref:AAA family ATPase n=1 Tax=Sulfurospirillum arcachonense TaxID=57666 RepID=UPI00046A9E12|nr:AAA family ATPase [Sulfurospirillum arcachonense]
MNVQLQNVKDEIQKLIVGQSSVIDSLLIALICEGHVLLEGVPGLAKTTMINTLAKTLGLEFGRVQFTPDLLPSDIVGAQIYNPKNSEFETKHGPVFTNLLLADEINRAPAKVQSALLEAMQERQVTIAENSYKLPYPFFVLATQNPLESEGTYSLPEAQLDRFMMKINVGYNTKKEEIEIAKRVAYKSKIEIQSVMSQDEIESLKSKLDEVHVDEQIEEYMADIIFATREPENYGLGELKSLIRFGASPRGTIDLHKASRAKALISGRDYVTPVDVVFVCKDVLRHRIILGYEAEADDISTDTVIDKIIEALPIP